MLCKHEADGSIPFTSTRIGPRRGPRRRRPRSARPSGPRWGGPRPVFVPSVRIFDIVKRVIGVCDRGVSPGADAGNFCGTSSRGPRPAGRGSSESEEIKRFKGIRWMPWCREAMKDVARCDKPRGGASTR